jgi:hypothetical protein
LFFGLLLETAFVDALVKSIKAFLPCGCGVDVAFAGRPKKLAIVFVSPSLPKIGWLLLKAYALAPTNEANFCPSGAIHVTWVLPAST